MHPRAASGEYLENRTTPVPDGELKTRQRLPLERVELPISGLECAGAAAPLAARIERIPGVREAMVNPITDKAVISFDPGAVSVERLVRDLEDEGLEVGRAAARWYLGTAGLGCPSSTRRLEQRIEEIDGVHAAIVNPAAGSLTVEYSPRHTDIDLIRSAVVSGGTFHESGGGTAPRATERARLYSAEVEEVTGRFWLAAAVLVPTTLFSYANVKMLSAVRADALVTRAIWTSLALFVLFALICAGWPIFRDAARALRHRSADQNTLTALAIAALWLHATVTVFGSGGVVASVPRYDTTVAVLAVALLGRMLQVRAHARYGCRSESDGRSARVVREGLEMLVPVQEVVVGDTISLRAGDQAVVDGEVVRGWVQIDEKGVTGSPRPIACNPGDLVVGGSVCLAGQAQLRAERIGKATLLHQVRSMEERALTTKLKVQRILEPLARLVAPLTLVLAILGFMAWFSWASAEAATAATAVLVTLLLVPSPSAIALAVPAPLTAGIRRAAAHGILFRSAEVAERTANVRTVELAPGAVPSTSEPSEAVVPVAAELGTMGIEVRARREEDVATAAEATEPARGRHVAAVVGDDVRERTALAHGKLALAITKASDAVLDQADIVIPRGDLEKVPTAIRMARRMRAAVEQNFAAVAVYHLVLIPMAAVAFYPVFGLALSPVLAAALRAGLSWAVVANAIRIDPLRPKAA